MKRIYLMLLVCLSGLTSMAKDNITVQVEEVGLQEWKMTVALENTQTYCAFQMDVVIPEGITYEEGTLTAQSRINGYTMQTTSPTNGNLRVLGYSATRKGISGTEGALFSIILKGDATFTSEQYAVVVKNIRFSDSKGVETVLTGLSVDVETGVQTPLAEEEVKGIYTLQGIRVPETSVRGLQPGIYVVNGRKVLRK